MMKVFFNTVVHSKGFNNSVLSLKYLLKSLSRDSTWTGFKILVWGTKSESLWSVCGAVLCEEGQSKRERYG